MAGNDIIRERIRDGTYSLKLSWQKYCEHGGILNGHVIDIAYAEDTNDKEDSLSLELPDGKILSIMPSEIVSIEATDASYGIANVNG